MVTTGERAGAKNSNELGQPDKTTKAIELTDEEADRMVTQALDCELPEPEPFVKILVLLYDLHEQDGLRN